MRNDQIIPLIIHLFKDLKCSQFSLVETGDDNILCGFKSGCSMILDDLDRTLKPLHVYKAGEQNYIAVFSRQAISDFMDKKLEEVVRRILPINIPGHYDKELGFVFLDQDAYQRFLTRENLVDAARAAGLDYGWEEKQNNMELALASFSMGAHFQFFPPHRPEPPEMDYWLTFYNSDKVYRAIFPEMEQRKIARNQRQAFLQAGHTSTSSANHLTNANVEPQEILRNVFSFLEKPRPPKEEKSSIIPQYAVENDDPSTKEFIRKIKQLIATLDKEKKDSSDHDLKHNKSQFLKSVLNFKKANPRFALSECVRLTENLYPNLYEDAVRGRFSRTKKLMKEIKENKKPVIRKYARVSL